MSEMIRREFVLNYQSCDEISELITEFCRNTGADSKDILRHRWSAEEALLFWLNHGCDGNSVIFSAGKTILVPYISIECAGERIDPFDAENSADDFGRYSQVMLEHLDLTPEYSYDNGRNCIRFKLKGKSPGQVTMLLITLAAAVALGAAGQLWLSANVRNAILDSVISPLCDTFFMLLGCIAGPMIFLSVAWGIYGIGDTKAFGRIGKKMIGRFLLWNLIGAAAAVIFFPVIAPAMSGGSETGSGFSSILELLLGIFPSNIVEPFMTGNTLQIIFMALVTGTALLYLGSQTSLIADAAEQLNTLVRSVMEPLSRAVPFLIFLVVLKMFWSGTVIKMLSAWKLMLSFAALLLVLSVVTIAYISIRLKLSPWLIIRKSIPAFIIAFSTASSQAAYSTTMASCEERFGIDRSAAKFGVPLGTTLFKPVLASFFVLMIFFFANQYDISTSPVWLLTSVIVSTIVATATPPVAGSTALAYSILFPQMGIPVEEALAFAIAIDMIADFAITGFNVAMLPLVLADVAGELNMLDHDVLKKASDKAK